MWWSYKPYVSVAQRRANAAKQIAKMAKKGNKACPVKIEGRAIARTFWGKAWCDHLESHSDYANRLPRGRTYVRNGSVMDLQIEPGQIKAMVAGSELYDIKISIKSAAPKAWAQIKEKCAGQIGSLIELLQGKLSQGVMEIITARDGGLFPKPAEIELDCSCPDYAGMCKHVAAVMYGIGARLDERPELLFLLRKVDHLELVEQAADIKALSRNARDQKTIAADKLADVFGIELEPMADAVVPVSAPKRTAVPSATSGKKAGRKKIISGSSGEHNASPAMPETFTKTSKGVKTASRRPIPIVAAPAVAPADKKKSRRKAATTPLVRSKAVKPQS